MVEFADIFPMDNLYIYIPTAIIFVLLYWKAPKETLWPGALLLLFLLGTFHLFF